MPSLNKPQCDEGFGPLLAVPIAAWSRVLAPATFLLLAAVASDLVPALGRLSISTTEQIVTVALIMILFDGGMGIGVARHQPAARSRHVVWPRPAQDLPMYHSAIPAATGTNPSNAIVAPLSANVPAIVPPIPTATSSIASHLQSRGTDHPSKRRASLGSSLYRPRSISASRRRSS